MNQVFVTKLNQDEQGWDFQVIVGSDTDQMDYSVRLDTTYFNRITNQNIEPELLIKRSFEFLLKREPREMILRTFNLKVIQQYFHEYENTVQSWIKS